jgi:hypothetical protein
MFMHNAWWRMLLLLLLLLRSLLQVSLNAD